MKRWIVLHDLEASGKTGIYHLEVIGRKVGDPAWKIERLVNHMAITRDALSRSVLEPLTKGAVYPEQFDNAFSNWKKLNLGKGGDVCGRSIVECMQLSQ